MEYPSSRYLTHDFVVWHGLTLKELLVVGVAGICGTELFALVIGYCLGYVAISLGVGLLLGFLLSARVLPAWVGRNKQGKPHGYLRKCVLLFMARLGLIQSPYLKHQGVWRTQRVVGEYHV